MATVRLPTYLHSAIRDAQSRADRVFEAVIGIVTKNTDDPKKLGRVLVEFPTLPGNDTSHWAAVNSLGAGKDRGWVFIPEIGDEVVVMFEHGMINRPVVVGALWNGVDTPPDTNDGGNNERRVFHSREGSRVEFLDPEGGGGTITIEDGKGVAKVVIDADANKITIQANTGDVCVQAPQGDVECVADTVEMSADRFYVHSTQGTAFGASSAATLKAQLLTVAANTLELNPGGVQGPQGTEDACEAVPERLTGAGGEGRAGQEARKSEQSQRAPAAPIASPAPAPAPSAPAPTDTEVDIEAGQGRWPSSRGLGGIMDGAVKAATRGILKGSGAANLPGIPMPDSPNTGGILPGESPVDDVVTDGVTGAVKSAVKAVISGGDVGDAARDGAVKSVLGSLPDAIFGKKDD